jgi:pyridoxine 5-phosphate synthase
VEAVAALPEMVELNIGHSIVARAVLVGISAAVREMRERLDRARDAG